MQSDAKNPFSKIILVDIPTQQVELLPVTPVMIDPLPAELLEPVEIEADNEG